MHIPMVHTLTAFHVLIGHIYCTNYEIFWCAHGQIQIGTIWSFFPRNITYYVYIYMLSYMFLCMLYVTPCTLFLAISRAWLRIQSGMLMISVISLRSFAFSICNAVDRGKVRVSSRIHPKCNRLFFVLLNRIEKDFIL